MKYTPLHKKLSVSIENVDKNRKWGEKKQEVDCHFIHRYQMKQHPSDVFFSVCFSQFSNQFCLSASHLGYFVELGNDSEKE